jgi:NADPH:quinone reductase-like Zn-dependent oxidoreductase
VLVKVEAVSLNYRDLLILENGLGGGYDLPLLPGSEFAGVASISRYRRNAIRARSIK